MTSTRHPPKRKASILGRHDTKLAISNLKHQSPKADIFRQARLSINTALFSDDQVPILHSALGVRHRKKTDQCLKLLDNLSYEQCREITLSIENGSEKSTFVNAADLRELLRTTEGDKGDQKAWLSDSIIDYYTTLIKKEHRIWARDNDHIHIFPTCWVDSFARPSKAMGIARKLIPQKNYKVFFPINYGNHWLVSIWHINRNTVTLYNSLSYNNPRLEETVNNHAVAFIKYHYSQYAESLKSQTKGRQCGSQPPQQGNGRDCGVYTLHTIHSQAFNKKTQLYPGQIPVMRKRMFLNILKGSISHHTLPPQRQGNKKVRVHQKRGIVTSPSKQMTSGLNNITATGNTLPNANKETGIFRPRATTQRHKGSKRLT